MDTLASQKFNHYWLFCWFWFYFEFLAAAFIIAHAITFLVFRFDRIVHFVSNEIQGTLIGRITYLKLLIKFA